MDMDARLQLFDLKTKYSFMTSAGVDQYNMPLYDEQLQPDGSIPPTSNNNIALFPVYQGFLGPAYINGVPVSFQTQKQYFYNSYPNIVQNLYVVGIGDGVTTTFTFQLPILSNSIPPNPPVNAILRGHVDITGIIATGNNIDPPLSTNFITSIPTTSVNSMVYITTIDNRGANLIVADSGQFLATDVNYGLLMEPGNAPLGNSALSGVYSTTSNTVNYFTGEINLDFPIPPANGANINVQCYFYQSGLPRSVLFNNNVLTLRCPPDRQYLVELDAYLTPAAFLNTEAAIPFGYMAEYISRGAARKILSDTGDVEQFQFYEPLFREQELLVWKRSQRQWTANRTETLYSLGHSHGSWGNGYNGGNIL